MKYLLVVMAVSIAGLYLPYLWVILAGKASTLETKLAVLLANWMRGSGPSSKETMENTFAFCVMFEITYFGLIFYTVPNLFVKFFSGIFAVFELVHMICTYRHWMKFFDGEVMIKNLLLWRFERISCMAFVMNATFVIISLLQT